MEGRTRGLGADLRRGLKCAAGRVDPKDVSWTQIGELGAPMARTTGRAPSRRKILLIERAFQVKFVAKVTFVIVSGTALTGWLLYLFADREFGHAFYRAHYLARSSWELLLPAVLVSSFASMCLVAALAVFLTLYDSHRIGGPLYRFRANLETIAEGDLTRTTRLREGDELRSLSDAMNGMTESLLVRVSAAKEAQAELSGHLGRAAALAQSDPGGAHAALTAALCARDKLAEALDGFRVSP